jgi:hypothetical protein
VEIITRNIGPFRLIQQRGLQLTRRELDTLRRAAEISFQAREALRAEGVDDGHGVDDLLELDGFVELDIVEKELEL